MSNIFLTNQNRDVRFRTATLCTQISNFNFTRVFWSSRFLRACEIFKQFPPYQLFFNMCFLNFYQQLQPKNVFTINSIHRLFQITILSKLLTLKNVHLTFSLKFSPSNIIVLYSLSTKVLSLPKLHFKFLK